MTDQEIGEAPNLRLYRTEIPNLYDDAGLDPYEFRLLAHYVRRGSCHETVRTTAEITKMSTGQVVEARKRLTVKGYITVTEQEEYRTLLIAVVDKWEDNFAKYSPRSPGEQGRSPHEQGRSPGEPKKLTLNKKEPNKKQKSAASAAPHPEPPLSKPKKSAGKKRDERIDHPAYRVYQELTHRSVPFAWRDEVCKVTDLEKWRAIVKSWAGKYNPTNIEGMLDVYQNGWKNGKANGSAPPPNAFLETLKKKQEHAHER